MIEGKVTRPPGRPNLVTEILAAKKDEQRKVNENVKKLERKLLKKNKRSKVVQ